MGGASSKSEGDKKKKFWQRKPDKSNVDDVIDDEVNAGSSAVSNVRDEASNVAGKARDDASGAFSKARDDAGDAFSNARDEAGNAAGKARDEASDAFSRARDDAGDAFSRARDDAVTAGSTKARGVADDVRGRVEDKVADVKESVSKEASSHGFGDFMGGGGGGDD